MGQIDLVRGTVSEGDHLSEEDSDRYQERAQIVRAACDYAVEVLTPIVAAYIPPVAHRLTALTSQPQNGVNPSGVEAAQLNVQTAGPRSAGEILRILERHAA